MKIHPVYPSKEEIEHLTHRLLDRSLPKAHWTHAAHLVAAYSLLHRYELTELTDKMPHIIRRYNEATQTANTDTEGYHETITLFYLKAIDHFIKHLPQHMDYAKGCTHLIHGPYGHKDFALEYYSKARLFSVEARKIWVEPDLQPFKFPEI